VLGVEEVKSDSMNGPLSCFITYVFHLNGYCMKRGEVMHENNILSPKYYFIYYSRYSNILIFFQIMTILQFVDLSFWSFPPGILME